MFCALVSVLASICNLFAIMRILSSSKSWKLVWPEIENLAIFSMTQLNMMKWMMMNLSKYRWLQLHEVMPIILTDPFSYSNSYQAIQSKIESLYFWIVFLNSIVVCAWKNNWTGWYAVYHAHILLYSNGLDLQLNWFVLHNRQNAKEPSFIIPFFPLTKKSCKLSNISSDVIFKLDAERVFWLGAFPSTLTEHYADVWS